MRKGFRIGSLFGIEINIDWSWLFIFFLVTFNLSVAFGQFQPDWGTALRWGMAILAALLFFASVLAHEMAHSLVAQARGIPVNSITLFLFGGVSNIQRNPDSPKTEFLMAVVGPLMSLIIGGVLLLVTGFTVAGGLTQGMESPADVFSQFDPLTTILFWLGSINVILGLFNLIPGFPLDGGRILRSALWVATDNLRKATRWASWVGHAIGWTMIVTGVAMLFGVEVPFFGSGVADGLWLAFIGWYLNNAAGQSYQRIVIEDILDDVPVAEMMRSDPPTVRNDTSVSSLVHDYVMGTDDQAFPVMNGDNCLVGLVTLEDVRALSRSDWENRRVEEIMTPLDDLVVTNPNEKADEAFNKLMQRDVRQLPVTDECGLVGMLRRSDIVRWLRLQSDVDL